MQLDDYDTIMTQIFAYGELLREYVDQYGLPEEWFGQPDHLTFVSLGNEHFNEVQRELLHDAESAVLTEKDGRRVVSALLEEPVYLESFGQVNWLQLVQPRLNEQAATLAGIQSVAYYWPHLEDAEAVLYEHGVSYTMDRAAEEHWITIPLNDLGHVVVLTDRTIADRVESELLSNDAEVIL